MVVGKVESTIDMPVILDLRTFGNREAKASEDVDDLLLDKAQRMTSAHLIRISRTGKVDAVVDMVFLLVLVLESLELLCSSSLECIEFLTDLALLLWSHIAEIVHKRRDRTLLAQILDAQSLDLFCILGMKAFNFGHQLIDFLYHIL